MIYSLNVVDKTTIYFSSTYNNSKKIGIMSIFTNEEKILSDDLAGYINIVGDWIYCFNGVDTYIMKKDGSEKTKLNDYN